MGHSEPASSTTNLQGLRGFNGLHDKLPLFIDSRLHQWVKDHSFYTPREWWENPWRVRCTKIKVSEYSQIQSHPNGIRGHNDFAGMIWVIEIGCLSNFRAWKQRKWKILVLRKFNAISRQEYVILRIYTIHLSSYSETNAEWPLQVQLSQQDIIQYKTLMNVYTKSNHMHSNTILLA